MMRSSNPAFAGNPFSTAMDGSYTAGRAGTMTVTGTIAKTFVLLAILTTTAAWTWVQMSNRHMSMSLMIGALCVAFPISLLTIFMPKVSPITGPLYAAAEGVFLGAISQVINTKYQGIAMQAVAVTMATTFCMLVIYVSGIIKVTNRLIMGISAATMGIFLVYLVAMVLSLFHIPVPFLRDSSMLSIGFSVFVVALAAFNLLIDFEFISRGAEAGAPKYMEWYTAFGLMVTLVWLYMEVLRLLSKLQDRR